MDDTDRMTAWQLRNDPEFRAVFISGIAANLRGENASQYDDDASPGERRSMALRRLEKFGDIIGDAVAGIEQAAQQPAPVKEFASA